MKKSLICLFSLIALLSGCGGSDEKSSAPSQPDTDGTTVDSGVPDDQDDPGSVSDEEGLRLALLSGDARQITSTDYLLEQLKIKLSQYQAPSVQQELVERFSRNDFSGPLQNTLDQFLPVLEAFKTRLGNYETDGFQLFGPDSVENDVELLRYWVLLADCFRREIQYPVNNDPNDGGSEFLRSYFADHLVYMHRAFNQAQSDLGDFSEPISTGSVSLVSKTLDFNFNPYGNYARMTGVYVLPGQSFSVTRTDDNGGDVSIFVNPQRSGSTKEFKTDSYVRPKFLSSHKVKLSKGESHILTSPYGGPLLIALSKSDSIRATIKVEDVADYAYLDDPEDSVKVSEFAHKVETSPISWAGIRSENDLEINIPREVLKREVEANDNGDYQAYTRLWRDYVMLDAFNLLGFIGPNLKQDQAVLDLCDQFNWDCRSELVHHQPVLQRFNIDYYATCGAGCSGNPIDMQEGWWMKPIGDLNSHELGHNLTQKRIKIYEDRSSEVANMPFVMHKAYSYYLDTGIANGICSNPSTHGGKSPQELYSWLQFAQNPSAYPDVLSDDAADRLSGTAIDAVSRMKELLWDFNGGYAFSNPRVNFSMQFIFLADHLKDELSLDNGWQLYTLLHLHDRLYGAALFDEATWLAERTKLGFSQFSFDEAKSIYPNDFMMLSVSKILARNLNNWFDAWGVETSDLAKTQVIINHGAAIAAQFYPIETLCLSDYTQTPSIPIDGKTEFKALANGNPSLKALVDSAVWEQGTISTSGVEQDNNNRIRTQDFINIDMAGGSWYYLGFNDGDEGNQINIIFYDENGTFLSTSGWIDTSSAYRFDLAAKKIRVLLATKTGNTSIVPSPQTLYQAGLYMGSEPNYAGTISELAQGVSWELGSINSSGDINSTSRVRTVDYIDLPTSTTDWFKLDFDDTNIQINIMEYDVNHDLVYEGPWIGAIDYQLQPSTSSLRLILRYRGSPTISDIDAIVSGAGL